MTDITFFPIFIDLDPLGSTEVYNSPGKWQEIPELWNYIIGPQLASIDNSIYSFGTENYKYEYFNNDSQQEDQCGTQNIRYTTEASLEF